MRISGIASLVRTPRRISSKITELQLPAGEAAAPEAAQRAVPEGPLDSDYSRSEEARSCSAVPVQHKGGSVGGVSSGRHARSRSVWPSGACCNGGW